MTHKFKYLAIAVFAIFVAAGTVFMACNKKTNKTDLVNGIDPMVAPDMDIIHLINDSLHHANGREEMKQIMDRNPWVAPRVVTFARKLGIVDANAKIDSVVFCWGSQDAQAQDKTGEWFKGKFTDQLVAFIFHDGKPAPAGVLVTCTNGVMVPLSDLDRIGTQSLEFTIEKGEGINSYVDFQTSIMLAERFNLSLYKGPSIPGGKIISPDEARKLEPSLSKVKVTVLVYPGDHFNLGTMTYTHAR